MATLRDVIFSNLKDNGDKKAVVIPDGGPSLSYKSFSEEVTRLRDVFVAGGLKPQEVVSIVISNNMEYLTTFFAVTWARGISNPLNPKYRVDEFSFYMEDVKTKILLLPKGSPEDHPAREAAKKLSVAVWEVSLEDGKVQLHPSEALGTAKHDEVPKPEDIAMFLHTSGTTSKPKGVPLRHVNITTTLKNIVNTYTLTPKDTSLIVMPLFHVHGLIGATLSTLLSGGTVVIPPKFSASNFWRLVKENNVSWYSAVSTIHQILLSRADSDKAPTGVLRFIRSCSASLAPVVIEGIVKRFGAPVCEAYGMTEAAHQMSSNPIGKAKPGSVGLPTNVEIAIMDTETEEKKPQGEKGEICIRGKNVTWGYHNRPEANEACFTENKWFRTGDQGFLDEEGYLTLTGRLKELINRGGEKISPIELDSVLLAHPKVGDAVAFAIPDEKYGEEVACAVIPKENETVTVEEIQNYIREKLVDFKVPKRVFVTDGFPRTATGKIQRRVVREFFLSKDKK